jgi:hypothetical protein
MLGSTGRGTGSEASTVIYSSISKIRGNGITVDNSNGTVVTVAKDGLLNVSANTRMTASSTVMISLNASDPSTTPLINERVQAHSQSDANFNTAVSAELFVVAGDVIRIYANTHATDTGANLNITHQEQEIQVAVSNVTPQYEDADEITRLGGNFTTASTNTSVITADTVHENTSGDGFQYIPSSSLGDSFVILKDGYYGMSFTYYANVNSDGFITKNASALNVNPNTLPSSEKLHCGFEVSGQIVEASWSGPLVSPSSYWFNSN